MLLKKLFFIWFWVCKNHILKVVVIFSIDLKLFTNIFYHPFLCSVQRYFKKCTFVNFFSCTKSTLHILFCIMQYKLQTFIEKKKDLQIYFCTSTFSCSYFLNLVWHKDIKVEHSFSKSCNINNRYLPCMQFLTYSFKKFCLWNPGFIVKE